MKYVHMVCESIIIVFTMTFLFIQIIKLIQLKLEIFLNFWNWIDLIFLVSLM